MFFLETSLSRLEIISCYLLGTVFRFSSHLKDSAVINKDKKVKANLHLQIRWAMSPLGTWLKSGMIQPIPLATGKSLNHAILRSNFAFTPSSKSCYALGPCLPQFYFKILQENLKFTSQLSIGILFNLKSTWDVKTDASER